MFVKKGIYTVLPTLVFSMSMAQGAFAHDVTIIGSIKHTLKEYTDSDKQNPEKDIQLLHIELSEDAKSVLESRAKDVLSHANYFTLKSPKDLSMPASIQLGMNKVPILDQGIHGTCTSFAITGAVDAIIGKGDYVSQLCQLQLGGYLETVGLGSSDWNGGYPITVINQMEKYGIANKSKQHSVGCGGLYHYPLYFSHKATSYMETAKFQEISEPVFGRVLSWSEIPASFSYNSNPEQTLADVKQALNSGDRLVFATLLPRTDLGNSGAVGKHNTWFAKDSWVLTPEILAGVPSVNAAHELIITGYDDNAVAVDSNKVKHTGLLILRNSWSWWAGYYGEFYMSYDYFKLLAYDVKRFTPNKS